jgi:nucleoside-diphosphate-sugar epimerase
MKSLTDRRVALIGGAGFIGHNLALELAGQGCRVEIVDSLQVNNLLSIASGGPQNTNRDLYLRILMERLDLLRDAGIVLHAQDARDYHALSRVLADMQPNVIIHLAAVAHANVSNKDPHSTFDHSLRTLENALDNARSKSLNVEHFVYFSSSMVYGNFKTDVVAEDTVCDPIGIYGALKLAGERMVIAYNQVFDLPYTIIRPSALYGERCVSRRVGQLFIENALRGMEVTVQGDGAERLDFTYVQDLVSGVLRVLENDRAINETFNITFGQSRSLREMATILKEHFPRVKVRYAPRDRLMPKRGTLCIDKAVSLLGYRPEYPLEIGFERYINWYKEMTDAVCAVG